jgi:hypothetical protein
MRQMCVHVLLVWFGCVSTAPALAMEIEWVRMTGHWPVETSPLVADVDGDGRSEILAVNRGGQVMLWALDGTAIGKGEDGTVAQLPQGKWTTTPTLADASSPARLLLCSVEGLVVALDREFRVAWQRRLPGKTTWGRAIPARIETNKGAAWCFGDESGTVTCLAADGNVVWTRKPEKGRCRAPLQSYVRDGRTWVLLVPTGTSLCCLGADGNVRWNTDLGGAILSRPEVLSLPDRTIVVCGAGSGSLFALSPDGAILWETPIGDEIDTSIALLPRYAGPPWILCTGLWGGLHAIRPDGEHVWTHLFFSKNRGQPLVLSADSSEKTRIVVATHRQHLHVFDGEGRIVDDARVNGLIDGSPVAMPGQPGKPPGVLLVTASLLVYRLRPSPQEVRGTAPSSDAIKAKIIGPDEGTEVPRLVVNKTHQGPLAANVSIWERRTGETFTGCVSARSTIDLASPRSEDGQYEHVGAVVRALPERWRRPNGTVSFPGWHMLHRCLDYADAFMSREEYARTVTATRAATRTARVIRAWPTKPYGLFSDDRLEPLRGEYVNEDDSEVTVRSLYADEADQGAFVVASIYDMPVDVRVHLDPILGGKGEHFAGAVVLRKVVAVESINGEKVWDALPLLKADETVTLAPQRAVKFWVSVDAHGARPGTYKGRIRIVPTTDAARSVELPLRIEVLPLRMPREFPLKLCTWDYVPNKLFPSNTPAVLDDMARHGVNIFPRGNCIPKASVNAAGELAIDWALPDAELDRLKGRGIILFHLGHPPITFAPDTPGAAAIASQSARGASSVPRVASPPADDAKRKMEIAYIRAFRDHLKARGLDYADYAFYPVDEPGLDYGNGVDAMIDTGRLFRDADPKLRIYTDPVPTISWKDFERIEPFIDIWCPNMRLVSGLLSGDPRIERIMKSGKPVWSYECVAQVKSLSPLRYNRANAWRAKHFGLSGIGFWTHSQTQVDPWQRNEAKNDEYALVYPGDPVVPSVRWEAVRDGLEDVAAIAMLEDRIKVNRRAGTKLDLAKQAEETLQVAETDVMDMSDEAFIESRDFLRQGDRRIGHTWTDVECFDRHRARIAELTIALGGG